MQNAVNDLWMYTGEFFTMNDTDRQMLTENAGPDLVLLKQPWTKEINKVFELATLKIPLAGWMQQGGKDGRHTENLGFILAELQFMQRTYPNMEW
jgi:ring-1,2-phenylacetyl-CoA epoxidase subunit PaaC